MKAISAAFACLMLGGCSVFKTASEAAAPPPAGTEAEAPATAGADASHSQLCSQLRADIASSQHNQRTMPPATNAPIIAAAGQGKEDQRIEALQQRYVDLGCVGDSPPSGDDPKK